MQVLHFTPKEKELFAALSDEVKEGWLIEDEVGAITDSPAAMRMRLALLEVQDPAIQAIRQAAEQGPDVDALASLIQKTDVAGASDGDLAELFFALGPVTLTSLIRHLIIAAQSDSDLDDISVLTDIRHSLLAAIHG